MRSLNEMGPDYWWQCLVATLVSAGCQEFMKDLDGLKRKTMILDAKAMLIILARYDEQ